ncbi:MAG: choline dehydrogenase [Rhodospirillaceae bacterium]|jgi:choline dehydrogenase|nr:choline dehydrogenase [Rhodospirillaceae bacterium]|tara:strand:- start:1053 stop:2681 length:1629 start_codon:yes stop_codon:yes gene_type:complete
MGELISKKYGNFDYIIVGAGTSGCLLANRLSADPKNRVLLLEAGGKDDYFWIRVPVGYLFTMNNPRTDWCFSTEASTGLNGRSLNYPRGKVLGGCSSINGMIYMRGQARDYDHWRQLGNSGWGWDEALKYFKRSEGHVLGENEMHGGNGEWRVEGQRLSWEILDAFRDAAAETGIPNTDDFNTGNNEGCGYFEVNQKQGVRWSAADAFLHPIKSRANLTVLTESHVNKLQFDGNKVVGVKFWRGNDLFEASVSGEIILASGAIGSPQIMQASGISSGALSQKIGIQNIIELPGVGENLQDHLQMRLVFKVKNTKTLNLRANSLFGKIGMGLEYFLFKRGPMTMAPSQLGGFAKSDKNKETPNLQYHIQPLSTEKLGDPLHPFEAFTASVCNLRPESRGHVHIKTEDSREPPKIQPDYLSDPADRKVAADAIKLTRKIVSSPAMKKFEPEEFKPGIEFASDDDLAREAGNIGTTIFHPVGTCKMGPSSDNMAVVDERLKVHGIRGLRVVDASVMPTITSGNTNSPTLMIAEKASEMILEDAPS